MKKLYFLLILPMLPFAASAQCSISPDPIGPNRTACQGGEMEELSFVINAPEGYNSNLPDGLTATLTGTVLIIGGSPVNSGSQPYSVTTPDGCSVSGTINVTAAMDLGVYADAIAETAITFHWNDAPGGSYVYFLHDDESGATLHSGFQNSPVSSYEATNLEPGKSYTFSIFRNGNPCAPMQTVTVFTLLSNRDLSRNNVVLYPNPAVDFFSIFSDGNVGEVVLYDVSGREVKRQSMQNAAAKIQVGELQSGVYFVEAFVGGKLIPAGRLMKK